MSKTSLKPWGRGVTSLLAGSVGVLAFMAGYVLTYLLKANQIRNSAELGSEAGELTWKLVGWLYMGMYNVPVRMKTTHYDITQGGQAQQSVTDAATTSIESTQAWDGWLLLIPPLLLIAAGYLLTFHRDTPAVDRAKAGLLVVLGYLPLVALSSVLFRVTESSLTTCSNSHASGCRTETVAGPDILPAILIAGVVYPVLFGSLGGYLGSRIGRFWESADGPSATVSSASTVGVSGDGGSNHSGDATRTQGGANPSARDSDASTSDSESSPNFCPDCGTELTIASAYCSNCGTELPENA